VINLRYHIVSITAVFLALGIGLAFGASFIEAGTIGALEQNLGEIEEQNRDLQGTNAELRDAIAEAERVEEGLREQGLAQLVEDQLAGVPVLLLAADGVDDDVVGATEAALVAAGAELAGVLRVTDRVVLDDQGEVDDLRTVLGLPNGQPSQLRIALTRQVATILRRVGGPPSAVGEAAPPTLLDDLLASGFLELDPADEPPDGFTLVPEAGVRIVAVTGTGASVDDELFLAPVLRGVVGVELTEPQAQPPVVVAVEPTAPPIVDGAEPPPPSLVAQLRADEALRVRLSTVDDLDSFAGLTALILALGHGAEGQVGHYGLGEDAQSLLPPAVAPAGDG